MSDMMWAYEFERTFAPKTPLPKSLKPRHIREAFADEETPYRDTLMNVVRLIFGRDPK